MIQWQYVETAEVGYVAGAKMFEVYPLPDGGRYAVRSPLDSVRSLWPPVALYDSAESAKNACEQALCSWLRSAWRLWERQSYDLEKANAALALAAEGEYDWND